VLAGNRLPVRTRDLVTDAIGLVTLLIAGLAVVASTTRPWPRRPGRTHCC
jgi:hypothetical protein